MLHHLIVTIVKSHHAEYAGCLEIKDITRLSIGSFSFVQSTLFLEHSKVSVLFWSRDFLQKVRWRKVSNVAIHRADIGRRQENAYRAFAR